MHTAWALAVFIHSRGGPYWLRLAGAFWLAGTVVATLGFGYHYGVDLLAGAVLCLTVRSALREPVSSASGRDWRWSCSAQRSGGPSLVLPLPGRRDGALPVVLRPALGRGDGRIQHGVLRGLLQRSNRRTRSDRRDGRIRSDRLHDLALTRRVVRLMNRPCCAERSSELHRKSRRRQHFSGIRWTARSPAGVGRAHGCVPVAAPTMNSAGRRRFGRSRRRATESLQRCGDAEGDPSRASAWLPASVAIAKSTTDSASFLGHRDVGVPGGLLSRGRRGALTSRQVRRSASLGGTRGRVVGVWSVPRVVLHRDSQLASASIGSLDCNASASDWVASGLNVI